MARWETPTEFLEEVEREVDREIYEMDVVPENKQEGVACIIMGWFRHYLMELGIRGLNKSFELAYADWSAEDRENYDPNIIVYHFTPEGEQYDMESGNPQMINDHSPSNIHITVTL
jgi:hypothetical protein